MKFSRNMENLGTETAFKVSMEANFFSKTGKKVYPFHLGDLNIETPLLIRNATTKYMNDNKNGYCPSEGVMKLRQVLANDIGTKISIHFNEENVVLASVMDKVDKNAKLILDELEDRRDKCVKLLNSIRGISLSTLDSTFYLYLNVEELMKNKNIFDIEKFRIKVLKKTGVAFCTRNHFGSSNTSQNENYIRLAYSGINSEEIKEGLICFKNWIEN